MTNEKPKRIWVLFATKDWTPLRRDVFEQVLPPLACTLTQGFYMALYDQAWHSRNKVVEASVSDFAAWTGADPRTLRASIEQLCRQQSVVCISRGRPKSRTRKPRWRVPLAEFALGDTGTPWTPVPRFFIADYFRAFRPSVILSVLLWHQHIGWRNDCWPGIQRLCNLTGWNRRTVYDALRTLGNNGEWKKITQHLPRPLNISRTPDQQSRHFQVLALTYEQKARKGHPSVSLTAEFAERFGVRSREKS